MAQTNVLRFADGVLVEIARNERPGEAISGTTAERTKEAFQSAVDTLGSTLRHVVTATRSALQSAGVSEAELELGVAFSAEGGVIISKVSTEGNLTVRIKFDVTKN